jgi:tRNA(Ile)-lysidine synthase
MTFFGCAVSSKSELPERVSAQIAPLLPARSSILIGLSGGLDSVVLLHLLHTLAARFSWQLSALHVHHGISRNADEWARFCADLCSRHHVPLLVEHVDIAPLRAHGIEAAARKLRHAAFDRQSHDFVALAHHADDQAETLLLQLLRGAGVRGASAMPLLAERSGSPDILRPLLHFSRQEIMDYAVAHDLQWIEDESNADESYPRNFLRHRLLPLLSERFPAYRDTLTRSAEHFAEASKLLEELARQDGAEGIHTDTLDVAALQVLSPARAKNLLRYFLHRVGAPMPQAVQLDDMLRQLCTSRKDAAVCVNYGDWQVRRYRGNVYALHALAEVDRSTVLTWHGEAELKWPALNARVHFDSGRHSQGEVMQPFGISLEKLQHSPVTLQVRHGGETLRPHPDAAKRSLKNLLQEHHIPPWRRDRLPLLYCGDDLVCAVDVAVSADYISKQGEAEIRLSLQ